MTPVADKPLDRSAPSYALPWISLLWFAALLALCYWPMLVRLIAQWNDDEDMGHGFFVPLIAGYIVWQVRDEFFSKPAKPNWMGLALVLYAAFQYCIGTLGAELFLQRTSIVLSLIGAVWFLGGTERLKTLGFPLFLLFFMVPIPAIVYNRITFPLQLIASQAAEESLLLIGIPVLREGNILELAGQKLSVVEACSGIRSLLTLSFLSLVYGYFLEKKAWVRALLFVATVPIAIVANAARVTLTGVLAEYKPELAHGFFHTMSGGVIFMVALVMLVVFHQTVVRAARMVHAR